MDFSQHLILSAAGAGLVYWGAKDPAASAAFVATGVFIDLDHLVDYFRETGLNPDFRRFMGYFSKRGPVRLWLIFHSWEWVALAFAGAWISGWRAVPLGAAAGWLFHLVLDQFSNRLHPLSYFFWFRVKNGFLAERMYID